MNPSPEPVAAIVHEYRAIVADPPWPIRWTPGHPKSGGAWWSDGKPRPKPGRELAYSTLSLEEIAALPVSGLAADDAVLFLWSTRQVFREGQAALVARAWGFEPCGEIVWGLRSPGLGSGPFRNDHEPVLVAKRGGIKLITDHVPLGVCFWRQVYGHNGRVPFKLHSAKPDGFYELVEHLTEGPYLDLFARRKRPGWDVWGDEVDSDVEMVA